MGRSEIEMKKDKITEKTIAISDIHIPYTDKSFLDFADYVISDAEIAEVIFIGDIIDSVKCTKDEIRQNPQGRALLDALSKIFETKKCHLVRGNPDLGETLKDLLGIEMPCHEILRKGDVAFAHGHQFDPVCSRIPWKLLKKIVPFFFETPRGWKKRNREKFVKSAAIVWAGAITYAENRSIGKMIVGHTHRPALIELEAGILVCDCGDWLDSRTYLEIENGKIALVCWDRKPQVLGRKKFVRKNK